MKSIILTLAFLFFIPAVSWAAEKETAYERVIKTGTIRCGYIVWNPYFYYKDLNDPSSKAGMTVDMMNEIGRVLGLKIEWTEEAGWGNIGEGLKSGRYDMVCTSMWPDAAKYKNFLLTRPLYYSSIYPWTRADDTRFDGDISKINDPSVKIAVVDGGTAESMARQFFPKATIVGIPPMSQSAEFFMTVTSGKADVINSDVDEMEAFLKTNPDTFRKVANIKPLQYYPHVMAVPADSPQMKDMVDSALTFLIDNGFMDEVVKKYDLKLTTPQKDIPNQ